jgi:hypothetical protein
MFKLMRRIIFLFLFLILITPSQAQKISFLVLGDLHYDLLKDHDMDWLSKKPDDLRQVTQEYAVYTRNNWDDFMKLLRNKVESSNPPVKAIIQLGDLSEGLAGSPGKAREMAGDAIKAIEDTKMQVPWILTKWNHDITGPGAPEAFNEIYMPAIRKYTKNPGIKSANYSWTVNNVQITCVDPWDKSTNIIEFLERELSGSKAAVKIVAIHEPVIPVTERCWHVLRNQPDEREKLLGVLARNKAIVLCAHLHRYSVVKRETKYGPIVQIMVLSVISDRNYLTPKKVITRYGASLAEDVPEWEPETLAQRKTWLTEESKYVTFYKQTDLPGYAILNIDSGNNTVTLDYFAAFGQEPYDRINISGLMNK